MRNNLGGPLFKSLTIQCFVRAFFKSKSRFIEYFNPGDVVDDARLAWVMELS